MSGGSQGKGLRVAGIVCAAVGLAAVGTGIGLALKTQDMSSEADKNGGTTQAQENLRRSLETWGWVSYGVGAAAIATGAVLYIAGWPHDKSTNMALLPALAPDGASMILRGRF
jgi:Tryptophan-associated transmembrane protein (Trp_oprn_chp)